MIAGREVRLQDWPLVSRYSKWKSAFINLQSCGGENVDGSLPEFLRENLHLIHLML